jgi:hypothetical protein
MVYNDRTPGMENYKLNECLNPRFFTHVPIVFNGDALLISFVPIMAFGQ